MNLSGYKNNKYKLIMWCLTLFMILTLGNITNVHAETTYSAYSFAGNNDRRVIVKDDPSNVDANWSFCLNNDKTGPGDGNSATGTYIKITNPTEAEYKRYADGGDYKKIKGVLYYYATHSEMNYAVVQNELYYHMGHSNKDTTWSDPTLKSQKKAIRDFAENLSNEEVTLIDSRSTFYLYREVDGKLQNLITCKVNPFEARFNKIATDTKANLAGAKIQLFKVNGDTKTLLNQNGNTLSGSTDTTASWISSANGDKFVLPEEGNYILHELAAPAGYRETDDIVFNMDAFGRITIDNNKKNIAEYTFTMGDAPETGKDIEIGKVDGAGKALSNAKIVIKQDSTTIKSWTSSDQNKTFKVAPGTYTFHEESAPTNYQTVKDFNFTVDDHGNITIDDSSVTYATAKGNKLTVTDTHTPTKVTFYKTWDTGTKARNVKLQLYVDGKAYGDEVTLSSSDGQNWSYSWNNVPYSYNNAYEVKEETSNEFYPVKIENNEVTYYEKYTGTDFKNLANDTQIMLVKRSSTQALGLLTSAATDTSAPLDWKNLSTYNGKIVNAPSEDSLWTITDNKKGVVQLKNVKYNNFQIINVKKSVDLTMAGTAATAKDTQVHYNNGYLQIGSGASSNWSLTYNNSTSYSKSNYFSCAKSANLQFDVYVKKTKTMSAGDNENVMTYDNKAYENGQATLKLKKVDANDHSKALSGATFSLYKYDASSSTKIPGLDITGTKVSSGTTADDGTLSFSDLVFGTYYVVEDTAPEGYEKLTDPVQISWVKDGNNGKAETVSSSKKVANYSDGVLLIGNTKNEKKTTSFTVNKGWDVGTSPQDIQVTLLNNGKTADIDNATVTLSAKNNYQYTWKDLDANGKYTVEEVTKSDDFKSEVNPSSGIKTFTKISSLTDLKDGDQIVLVTTNQDANQALGVKSNATSSKGDLRLVTLNTGSLGSSTLYSYPADDTLWSVGNLTSNTFELSNVKYSGLKIANTSGKNDSIVSLDDSLINDMYYDSSNRLRFGYGSGTWAMTYNKSTKEFTCSAPNAFGENQLQFAIYKVNTVKSTTTDHGSTAVINNKSNNTESKTASMKIKKYEVGDTSKLLANAKFQLYEKDDNGTETIPHTTIKGSKVGQVAATDDQGQLTFSKLNMNATLYLVETEAPDGYQALDEAIGLSVSDDGDISLLKTITNVSINDGTLSVGDEKAYTLPDTGGSGTEQFLIVGLLLISVSIIMMIKKYFYE